MQQLGSHSIPCIQHLNWWKVKVAPEHNHPIEAMDIHVSEPCPWRSKHKIAKRVSESTVNKALSFDSIKSEVLALGASGRSKREQKQAQEAKWIALGGSTAKKPKVPLPILKGMRKKQKERARAEKHAQREADIIVAKPSSISSRTSRKRNRKH